MTASSDNARREVTKRFAPEFRLALACAHWPLRKVDREEISHLAGQALDWRWFKRIIERNQIVPLAYHNLREVLVDERHSEILRELRDEVIGYTRQSMHHAAELVRITEFVKTAGFEVVALKGASLAVLAYGNLAMRSPGDIDLLVSGSNVFEIERLMVNLGYVRSEPRAELTPKRLRHYLRYYKHFTYFSPAKRVVVELHWRLFHNIPLLAETHETIPPTRQVRVGSGVVSALSPDELFLYLCVHGAIHGWLVLKWIADMGALLSEMTSDDLRRIAALASERELGAEVRAALTVVDLFLEIDRPALESTLEISPVADRIVEMAQRLLTANAYCLEVHRLPQLAMFFYDLRLRSSWRYRTEDIRRALLYPDDWERVNLPDALFPLYAAVRPVSWLFRHFPRRSRRASVDERSPGSLSS